jgi:3-isopropylmalate/(R)-2-methylmalate dehydratase small subunit
MILNGRVWIFKDNDINTDLIYPGKYTYEPLDNAEQASHAMEDYDPSFSRNVQPHDLIVTGNNFGCGSSREQAVTCLKYAGIDAVIATSFARLFFRNAINSALPVVECPQLVESLFEKVEKTGSILTDFSLAIDLNQGTILAESTKFSFPPWDDQAMLIFESGGLVEFTKQKLSGRKI